MSLLRDQPLTTPQIEEGIPGGWIETPLETPGVDGRLGQSQLTGATAAGRHMTASQVNTPRTPFLDNEDGLETPRPQGARQDYFAGTSFAQPVVESPSEQSTSDIPSASPLLIPESLNDDNTNVPSRLQNEVQPHEVVEPEDVGENDDQRRARLATAGLGGVAAGATAMQIPRSESGSSSETAVDNQTRTRNTGSEQKDSRPTGGILGQRNSSTLSSSSSNDDTKGGTAGLAAAVAGATVASPTKEEIEESRDHLPLIERVHTSRSMRDLDTQDLYRELSRRQTHRSQVSNQEDDHEMERLMSRMFGSDRRNQSEEEKTRHQGVVFKNLTVKGEGLGAAIQPTVDNIFLGPFRAVGKLFKGKRSKTPVRTLLDDFSGCVRPKEMLLVLGRPGSGCSTFLKVIANQRSGFTSIDGDVTYGGTTAKDMQKSYRGEILYNPEDDLHYATLTVKNTLEFAIRTRTPPKASRNDGESKQQYNDTFLKVLSKVFWIEHTLGTKVGNQIVRGVSGGEKKRVSIGEAMVTKASCQAWDNSTKGLDASTALEYVSSLRALTNMAEISTLVALYQAGQSLYELFDKVILIDEGKCIYYGPTEDAKAYFENLGYVCPDRWTIADFLTSVTDVHERQIKEGWEDRVPRNAQELADAYVKSEQKRLTDSDINSFENELNTIREERHNKQGKDTKKKNFTISFQQQVWVCTKRQFLVMKGDPLSLGGKWGGILFQSLIVGSLFYNLPKTSAGVFPRGGVMFFTLLFNALLALAELTSSFEARPIMLKHKTFSFYRPSAFAIAQVLADLPLTLIQVLIFDLVVYFMANLQRTAAQFFINVLATWLATLIMYSFFRALGAWNSSLDNATRLTGVAIQALVVYTGYLIPISSMKVWFSWIRFINPLAYGFEVIMTNEFYNLEIDCTPPFLVPFGPGADTSGPYQSCLIGGSTPGSTVVQGANYLQTSLSYTRSHLWRNIGIMIGFWIFFVVLTAIGMERQKPNKGGAAVTIFKRGEAPKHVEEAMQGSEKTNDEEQTATDPVSPDDQNESDENEVAKIAKNDAIFTWQDVNYTIPVDDGTRKLLSEVNGFVRPGKLTALMGASGAGKTTLLNTLAQRITFGTVTGDFKVDGRPLPRSFQRATGFAEQQDIHEPTQTVREAMQFSALLRQPNEVPKAEKYEYVERIIDLLEMRNIAGAMVGVAGAGLNQEQRKRLTIGVELASKPELLMFLDEPTSGLDSGAAFNIVRFLRKLADAGQAILCTIHQPSAVLIEQFDELILLKTGGRVVYHGELGKDSQKMIKYFESNGAHKCPPDMNPAEYMLEAIGAGDPNYKGKDYGDVWVDSHERKAQLNEIEGFIQERGSKSSSKTNDDREYAMPLSTQMAAVIKRTFIAYWRNTDYVIGKFMLHIFTALFNTFSFFQIGNSQIDMQSRLFSVFMTLTISPPLIQQLQPRFIAFRNVYESRESNAKIYKWTCIIASAVLVEIPYSLVAGTLYWVIWYFPIGFPRDSFTMAYVWGCICLFELFYTSFGQFIASVAPTELLASILVPVFFLFIVSFCGIVVPYATIPTFWRSWMYHLSPFTYLLEGLLGAVVHDVEVVCSEKEFAVFSAPPGQTCQSYTASHIQQVGGYVQTAANGDCQFCQYRNGDEFAGSFNVNFDNHWRDFGVFIAYIIFNWFLVFALSWLYLGGFAKVKKSLGLGSAAKAAKVGAKQGNSKEKVHDEESGQNVEDGQQQSDIAGNLTEEKKE